VEFVGAVERSKVAADWKVGLESPRSVRFLDPPWMSGKLKLLA
jgi:hypothetical protein